MNEMHPVNYFVYSALVNLLTQIYYDYAYLVMFLIIKDYC